MGRREPLMSDSYFNAKVEYLEKAIRDRLQKLHDRPDIYIKPEIFLFANFHNSYELIFIDYSRGQDLDVLSRRFTAVISSWEQYQASAKSEVNDFALIDHYVVSLWLLSFAILFDVEKHLFGRLLQCIGNNGRDLLFERLAATRIAGRKEAKELCFPKPYETLYEAMNATGDTRSKLMMQFLKTWYKSLRDAYWHECHKGPQGGGFFGYWCIEAAGVVRAFGIDDQSFREMPYYPKDLIRQDVSLKEN